MSDVRVKRGLILEQDNSLYTCTLTSRERDLGVLIAEEVSEDTVEIRELELFAPGRYEKATMKRELILFCIDTFQALGKKLMIARPMELSDLHLYLQEGFWVHRNAGDTGRYELRRNL